MSNTTVMYVPNVTTSKEPKEPLIFESLNGLQKRLVEINDNLIAIHDGARKIGDAIEHEATDSKTSIKYNPGNISGRLSELNDYSSDILSKTYEILHHLNKYV